MLQGTACMKSRDLLMHAGGLGADAALPADVPKDRRSGITGESRAMKYIPLARTSVMPAATV
jgi:hypothetical protein